VQFEKLPPEEQERLIGTTIPKLFMPARLEHLTAELQETVSKLSENTGLMLWGKQGVGKTYAMAAIIREYISQGCLVARIGYEMLCLRIRDTYKPNAKETELSVIEPLNKVDKLFIEDVGTTVSLGRQESDFSLRTFLVLIDQRLEACLPTFITTNRTLEQLKDSFDERIASRLVQACQVIKLTGKDKRYGNEA